MKDIDPNQARQGQSRNIVRWVLLCSLILVVLCMGFLLLVFA